MLYMWVFKGKPDAVMSANGLLAGLVAITAPSGFVNPTGSAIIGFIAGVLVCLSVSFIENKLKVDDPVGAISVHGACGLWGVLSVGLFADGKSNYGGAWNGVTGSVTGLFYGDASQLVAQLVGIATLVGFRLHVQLRSELGARRSSSASASRRRQKLKASIFQRWDSSAIPSLSLGRSQHLCSRTSGYLSPDRRLLRIGAARCCSDTLLHLSSRSQSCRCGVQL